MIRINLLPFRLARKKENIRRQVSIFLLTVLLIMVGLYYGTRLIDAEIDRLQKQIAAVKMESKKYEKKARKVAEIKKKLKILDDKLNVVASLKTRRNEKQILLEEIADRVVKERMWIESLTANNTKVTVAGVAYDNPTIADFMRNLERSPIFRSVDLKRSRLRTFQGGVNLKSFELSCAKKTAAKKAPKKGKKK